MMIKTLIVEDEDLASKRLTQLIDDVSPNLIILKRTSSIEETVQFLKNSEIDLMFLDINLSDGLSFKIFEKENFKTPPIIFTTAYSEFAIKAFELNSISYLLKPINRKDLKQAVEKFEHLKNNIEKNDFKNLVGHLLKNHKNRFLIKTNNNLEVFKTDDISYFYSEDKLTFIMLTSGKSYPYEQSLKWIEQQVNPSKFYRINRKYLIHLSSIKEMYYTSKSRIKVELQPQNKNDNQLNFVAIEKIGQFKKWLSQG